MKKIARVFSILIGLGVYLSLSVGLPYWARGTITGFGTGDNWWQAALLATFAFPIGLLIFYLVSKLIKYAWDF